MNKKKTRKWDVLQFKKKGAKCRENGLKNCTESIVSYKTNGTLNTGRYANKAGVEVLRRKDGTNQRTIDKKGILLFMEM